MTASPSPLSLAPYDALETWLASLPGPLAAMVVAAGMWLTALALVFGAGTARDAWRRRAER